MFYYHYRPFAERFVTCRLVLGS